jgi:ferrous iron transport protein A
MLTLPPYLDLVKIKYNSKSMRALSQLKSGQTATIASFSDDIAACKLMSMGLLPGNTVQMIRKAPFGGAVYIKADNQQFAIRNSEAECIVLK